MYITFGRDLPFTKLQVSALLDVYFNQVWVNAVWRNESFPFKGNI